MMPGRTLHRLAAVLLPPDARERVIDAQLADFQHEWSDAHPGARRGLILVRGYCAFWRALAACSIGGWKGEADDRRRLRRALGVAMAATAGAMTLLMLPPLSDVMDPVRLAALQQLRWMAVTSVIPQALPLAVPLGLLVGILVGLEGRRISNRLRTSVLLVAIACSLGSFVNLAWVMPAANDTFRVAYTIAIHGGGRRPMKEEHEFTIGELRQYVDALPEEGLTERNRKFMFEYHLRWSLALEAFVLAMLGLSVITRRAAMRLGAGVAAYMGYYVLLMAGEHYSVNGTLPALVGAWLPNLVILAMAFVFKGWWGRLPALRCSEGKADTT